jgi:hypothetical protein
MIRNRDGRSIVPRSGVLPSPTAPECAQHMSAEGAAWRPADGILFSVVSSLALWSALFTSVYTAIE